MFEDLVDEEALTEIPEPEGLPEPRSMPDFFGHETLEKQMLDLIQGGNIPHALVLAGPKGIGKATFAYRLARTLLKQGIPDPNQDSLFGEAETTTLETMQMNMDDPVFRKVMSGGHPDLLAVERPMDERKGQRKNTLDVESVRKIAPFLRMTSSEGGWRVVIIDDADTMNRNSQNAVLKVLEEPPKHTVLILVCHRPGALIPTIRSRSRFIPMANLPEDIVTTMLKKEYPGELEKDLNLVAVMAEGSIGRALQFMDEGGIETIHTLIDILKQWPKWNWPSIHRLADSLGRPGQDQAYKSFTRVFEWVAAAILFSAAKNTGPLPEPLDHQSLQAIQNHYSLEEWGKICENLKDHFETFSRANLDKRQAVLGAFSLLG